MKSKWSEVREYEAAALKLLEPELWEKLREPRTPEEVQEAYGLFAADPPEGFCESFKEGKEGWCEIVPVGAQRFAVYGVGSVGNSPLHVTSTGGNNG